MCLVVCSLFVLMHAAEPLHFFHRALPRTASCRESAVAPGHGAEKLCFCVFYPLGFNSLVVAGALMRGEFCVAALHSGRDTSGFCCALFNWILLLRLAKSANYILPPNPSPTEPITAIFTWGFISDYSPGGCQALRRASAHLTLYFKTVMHLNSANTRKMSCKPTAIKLTIKL